MLSESSSVGICWGKSVDGVRTRQFCFARHVVHNVDLTWGIVRVGFAMETGCWSFSSEGPHYGREHHRVQELGLQCCLAFAREVVISISFGTNCRQFAKVR